MDASGEPLIYKDVSELHTGTAERWFPRKDTPKRTPVEPSNIVFAGVVCGPLSTKNTHRPEHLRTNAEGTDTQITMDALTKLAVEHNQTLELAIVENRFNFLGTSNQDNSCYKQMKGTFAQLRPHAFFRNQTRI